MRVAAFLDRTKDLVAFERRAAGTFEMAFERHRDCPIQTPELTDDGDQISLRWDYGGHL
jgi:hypothetical protein